MFDREIIHALFSYCARCNTQPPNVSLLTNDGLPFSIGLCDLIGTAHLTEGHATDDEDHDSWTCAVLSRCFILVPLSVPSAATAESQTQFSPGLCSHYDTDFLA